MKIKTGSPLVLNYISAYLLKTNWLCISLELFGNCFLSLSNKVTVQAQVMRKID